MVSLEGRDLGSCKVVHQIHRAQTDDVYQVRQTADGAETIVRIVHALLAPMDPLAAPDVCTTFAAMAAAIAQLRHPHIVPLYDFGDQASSTGGSLRYVIMPDLPDGSLADALAQGAGQVLPLQLSTAAVVAGQAAAALQHAHDAGLVHSTVNLHTMWLRQPPTATTSGAEAEAQIGLADFGLSRFLPGSSLAAPRVPMPDCLAPELRDGVALPASDQYALACVLYLLLVGQPLGAGGLSAASAPPSRLNPALPPAVDAVLATALAADPQQRYPRVIDFATALWTALRPAAYAQRAPAVVSVPNAANAGRAAGASGGPEAGTLSISRRLQSPRRIPGLSRREVLVGVGQVAGAAALGAACASALALKHKLLPAEASPPAAPSSTTQQPIYSRGDSVGFFRPSASTFILLSSPATPGVVIDVVLGEPTDLPLAGHWNGGAIATVGVFKPSQGLFFLASANRPNSPLAYDLAFGAADDLPLVGDWTGIGRDGIGVFRPSVGLFLLKNTLTSGGEPDFIINFGQQGDIPLAGDWNGDGKTGIGVYRPGEGMFYLTDLLCSGCTETSIYQISLGKLRGIPFAGDWQHSGRKGLGLFQAQQGIVYLKNDATYAGAPDFHFSYSNSQDLPIAGHWGAFSSL